MRLCFDQNNQRALVDLSVCGKCFVELYCYAVKQSKVLKKRSVFGFKVTIALVSQILFVYQILS